MPGRGIDQVADDSGEQKLTRVIFAHVVEDVEAMRKMPVELSLQLPGRVQYGVQFDEELLMPAARGAPCLIHARL